MNNGRLAVMGLAAALGIGTTFAVLDYRNDARGGELVELSGDDLQARTRDDAEAEVIVEEDDAGAGDDPNETTRNGQGTGGATTGGQAGDTTQNDTTGNGQGTGGKTTGGQRGDTTQTTRGDRGTGGATTGGPANDTTQSVSGGGGGGGGVFVGGGSGGGSGSGGGT